MTGPSASKRTEASLSSVLSGTKFSVAFEKLNCRETESCYLLKYVQKRAQARSGVNPWSLSQSLVYQKVSFGTERADHILIKPCDPFTSRLKHSLTEGSAMAASIASDWTRVHAMAFDSVDESFRDCFNFLDERISEIVRSVPLLSMPDQAGGC